MTDPAGTAGSEEWLRNDRYMDGIINIYKEQGYTSHDVIARMRGISGQRRAGHTGTLDPDAEGVLPVCLGTATRVVEMLTDTDKVYEAVVLLGVATDTEDISGEILAYGQEKLEKLRDIDIIEAVESFRGEYMQVPPVYSAIKQGGKKLCELAREGKESAPEARSVKIKEIEVMSNVKNGRLSDRTEFIKATSAVSEAKNESDTTSKGSDSEVVRALYKRDDDSYNNVNNERSDIIRSNKSGISADKCVISLKNGSYMDRFGVTGGSEDDRFKRNSDPEWSRDERILSLPVKRFVMRVECSKGTYIRSLCRDIGEKLGCHATMEKLIRTRVGNLGIETSLTLQEAQELAGKGQLEGALTSTDECFMHLPALHTKEKYDAVLENGNIMFFRHFKEYIEEPASPVRVYTSKGAFLAVYEFEERRKLYKPLKMFTQ
ncbi:MAG: tRNA pseudouridine(55) synthase TruB [Lachnospiraceae bacterium]|nr:tRNA pseudouridine(55) synthase TruB [Lachnospiraceae bacterium]